MIKFLRNYWYYLTSVVFLVLAFYTGFWRVDRLTRVEVILMYSFMALLAHQFEEYVFPGGAPTVLNVAFYGETTNYDRFPGNKQNGLVVNLSAYPFYIAAILLPDLIWLGLATMYFGFFQTLGHGVFMNVRGKTLYNPGMATAVLLHLPIGIYYIVYVTAHHTVGEGDYLYGFFGFAAATVLIVILPVQGLKDRNSPYPFSREELNGHLGMLEKYRANGVLAA